MALEQLDSFCKDRQHLPGSSVGKEFARNEGDLGWEDPLEGMATHSSIPAWRMDRGVWRATVHGVTKIRT